MLGCEAYSDISTDYAKFKVAGSTQRKGSVGHLRIIFYFTFDEWLLDTASDSLRSMLLELLELRYDATSTVFCTQYPREDWHHRLGAGVHADAIMDRIVHNTIWIPTGSYNMREHTAIKGH